MTSGAEGLPGSSKGYPFSAGNRPAMWPNPIWATALLALMLALLAGQLARFEILSSVVKSGPVLLLDVALLALWLASAFHVSQRPVALRMDSLMVLVVLFALWGLAGNLRTAIQAHLSPSQLLFASAYLVRWVFYAGAYFWAIVTLRDYSEIRGLVAALHATIIAFACFGIVQAALLPDFAFTVYPDAVPYHTWDIQGHRLVSTFLDPNFAGDFLAMGILLSLPAILRRRGRPTLAFLLLTVALFLTASRGAALAAIAGSCVTLGAMRVRLLSRRTMRWGAIAVTLVAGALALAITIGSASFAAAPLAFLRQYNKLSPTDPSAWARLLAWAKDIEIFASAPLLGIGFNTLGFIQSRFGLAQLGNAAFGLDGGILFIAALTGLGGSSLYLALLFSATRRAWRLARNARAPAWMRDLGASAAGITVLVVVHGFFVNSLFYPFLIVPVWLLWGAVSRSSRGITGQRVPNGQ